jgi:cytosine/adenosine deaminase-related metal-dependent hydrolase
VNRVYAPYADPVLTHDSRLRYVTRERREQWHQRLASLSDSLKGDSATRKLVFETKLEVVGEMNRAGVGILAGTDVAAPYVLPGFSLHDELALLVRAGLTPVQALQAATHNPARFLAATDSLGSIERGKLADLVLLEANPLADIRNTKRIRGVVVNGRYLDHAALDVLLTEVERRVASGRP